MVGGPGKNTFETARLFSLNHIMIIIVIANNLMYSSIPSPAANIVPYPIFLVDYSFCVQTSNTKRSENLRTADLLPA